MRRKKKHIDTQTQTGAGYEWNVGWLIMLLIEYTRLAFKCNIEYVIGDVLNSEMIAISKFT